VHDRRGAAGDAAGGVKRCQHHDEMQCAAPPAECNCVRGDRVAPEAHPAIPVARIVQAPTANSASKLHLKRTCTLHQMESAIPMSFAADAQTYCSRKVSEYSSIIKERQKNLRRLEAQRNELNNRVRSLRDELMQLQESAGHIGEVIKVLGKNRVLVKVGPEGKYICEIDQAIDQKELKANLRVALKSDSYALYKILPSKVDPLVSLMRVEKVPDSSYDTIGGLDKQIKEIKEVVELPIKHPEIFESLGIAQPKGVLLYGPPGTGKTLLARAVAHHTDCCFIRVSGSELVQKYIGEGSRMVRELFIMAREHAPSIIFMDEVGSTRCIYAGV
jgi:26S proteasome regulatory subunit T6